MTLRIGLAGVHGHGRGHLDRALALERGGEVRVCAVADPRGPGEVPSGVVPHADAAAMIDAGGLDIVVLSTPIPTHAPLAQRALASGAHVLLEKPPVVTVADHDALQRAAVEAGRAVQVGFQSLGGAGVAAAADMLGSGAIGEVLHVAAVGVWTRSEEYWRRAGWSGHRRLDGVVVADGAVTNPLAHALATALAIAGAQVPDDVATVETDMWRANDIRTDDTSSLRVRLRSGRVVTAALVTTGDRRHEPYILVRGTRGQLVYHYTLDVLHLTRSGAPLPRTFAFSRRELLADLCAHARTGSSLAVPLAATGAFTRVLEEIVSGPEPGVIAPTGWTSVTRAGETFREVRGIADLAERAAWDGCLFREIDGNPASLTGPAPWTSAPPSAPEA